MAPDNYPYERDIDAGGRAPHPSIIRASDIRGVVGETLFAEDARAIGQAFGTVVKSCGGDRVAVGYDGRLTSPELENALCLGLAASGIDVIRIGRGPSPMLYFAVHHLDVHGGIMVTGSHNPPEFNGFKMMLGKAGFFGRDIGHLAEIAAKGAFHRGDGSIREISVVNAYRDRLLVEALGVKEMKVAWDPGNGATADIVRGLVPGLPGYHRIINGGIDGTFPAHHPDPTVPKNLEQLKAVVREDRMDIGVAFDGDGDRIGVIDHRGRILWGDQLMMLFAEEVLKSQPGAPIIADVKTSQALFDRVACLGGEPVMWKTGHSFIKSKMTELRSPLAGEMSGHIFFADRFFGFDDALYAAVRLLALVSRSKLVLADLVDALPKMVNTPELRFDCRDDQKADLVEAVGRLLTPDHGVVSRIDGLRVNTGKGWWLLRASNTQPVLVARCEAENEKDLETLRKQLTGLLRDAGYRGEMPEELYES